MITFGQYPVTGTAVAVSTALGFTTETLATKWSRVTLQYNDANTAVAYLGLSTVTVVPANAGYSFPTGAGVVGKILVLGGLARINSLDLRDMFLIGTANALNIFFITLER